MALYKLSEEDVLILRQVVGWWNTRGRSTSQPIRQAGIVLARAGEDGVSKGETGTFTVYYVADTKGSEQPGEEQIEAYVRMGDVPAATWVYLVPVGNGWEVLAPECEAAEWVGGVSAAAPISPGF